MTHLRIYVCRKWFSRAERAMWGSMWLELVPLLARSLKQKRETHKHDSRKLKNPTLRDRNASRITWAKYCLCTLVFIGLLMFYYLFRARVDTCSNFHRFYMRWEDLFGFVQFHTFSNCLCRLWFDFPFTQSPHKKVKNERKPKQPHTPSKTLQDLSKPPKTFNNPLEPSSTR